MARTYASLNEAWRELRNARKRAHEESYSEPRTHHGYDTNQPRVPKGHPDGGQWTDTGGGASTTEILSDATPDNEWSLGSQYANRRGRGSVSVRIGNRWFEASPGQAAELAAVQTRYNNVIARVRELDPGWKPARSLHQEDVGGYIRAYKGETLEAEARLAELTGAGIGPGPFAGESIPARGAGRDFTAAERREINRILNETGCHTCGSFNPGTRTGNAVPDHQPPTRWNPHNRPQRLYPQCLSCSARQGNWMMRNNGAR
jgi:hypothetical protein